MSGLPTPASIDCALDAMDELWDFDDAVASERRFRDLLERAAAAGIEPARTDLVRTQIARALSLQRRFDEAHALLDAVGADDVDQADSPRHPTLRVRALLERGRTFNTAGRRDEAASAFDRAWQIARAAGHDALAIDAAHMRAIAEVDLDRALAWNEEALRLADSSSDPGARKWRGSLRNNLGWTLHAQGKYEAALRQFEEALAARRQQGNDRLISIARWCIARCLRSLGRLEEALAMQQGLGAEHESRGMADGFVHEEIGECLLALGRGLEAQAHFARAHVLLARDSGLGETEPGRLERLALLARPSPQN